MNTRSFTLSLVIAGLAMFMVYTYLDSREKQFTEKYGAEKSVLVAKIDIKELEILDETKVNVITVPQNFLAPGHLNDKKQIYNTIAAVPIKKGEQITEPRIIYPGSRSGLSRQISPGKRAFSIVATSVNAVSKLIMPGDRVDVLAYIDYGGGAKDQLKLRTILQDVMVLATGYKITNNIPVAYRLDESSGSGGEAQEGPSAKNMIKMNVYTDYSTLTLELTPFEVQKVAYAMGAGATLFLALRNNEDKQNIIMNSSKLFDLLGDEADEAKRYFETKNNKDQNIK